MNVMPLPTHDTTRGVSTLRPFIPLHWVLTKHGRAVAIPGGRIALEGTADYWRCVLYSPDHEPIPLVSVVPYRYAKEAAEDYILSIGAEKFADPSAAWRRRPATAQQRAVLRRRRIRIWRDMTAGEASDRITSRARRRR